jgi:hypothetical protein
VGGFGHQFRRRFADISSARRHAADPACGSSSNLSGKPGD